jgi:hypothetical protein
MAQNTLKKAQKVSKIPKMAQKASKILKNTSKWPKKPENRTYGAQFQALPL